VREEQLLVLYLLHLLHAVVLDRAAGPAAEAAHLSQSCQSSVVVVVVVCGKYLRRSSGVTTVDVRPTCFRSVSRTLSRSFRHQYCSTGAAPRPLCHCWCLMKIRSELAERHLQ